MSKAYPSNLTRVQYEFMSDMIPEQKPGGRAKTTRKDEHERLFCQSNVVGLFK